METAHIHIMCPIPYSGVGTGGAIGPPNNLTEGAWPPQKPAHNIHVFFSVTLYKHDIMYTLNKDSLCISFVV